MSLFRFSNKIPIGSFLKKIGKEKYTDILEENGFHSLRSIGNYINQDYGFTRSKLMEIIKDGKEVSVILDLADKEIGKNLNWNILVCILLFIVLIKLLPLILD